MTTTFRAIVVGGTGQVGGAVVEALLATPGCRQVILVSRRPLADTENARLRVVVLDPNSDAFETRVTELAKEVAAQGDRVVGASCVGVGSGTARLSDEDFKNVEVGIPSRFARGLEQAGVAQFCLLSAVGSNATSRIRYVRVMGLKEEAVRAVGLRRLAIFRPGIIAGNANTPRWTERLGALVPGPWGNIDKRDIGRAFAAEFTHNGDKVGVTFYDNRGMRALLSATPV